VRFLILSLLPFLLLASPLPTVLLSVDGDRATARVEQAEPGLSGIVVRRFNDEHSAIIADAIVTAYDAQSGIASLRLSPFGALEQNALPRGTWSPEQKDELLLAPDYARALLIAPNATVYDRVTASMKTRQWVHPDRYAAFLSVTGHPTPTREDFTGFCMENAVGLLYIHLESRLYTLDCKSFTLLHTAEAPMPENGVKLPFYSRVDTIRKALWGTGSSDLETYAPHYLELIREAGQAAESD
jgi:hypothetical protein